MPTTVSVDVPNLDDVKNVIDNAEDRLDQLGEAAADDLEETKRRSNPKNFTVTQKAAVGGAVVVGLLLVYRTVKRLRHSIKVVAEDVETGEMVEGTLITE